MPSLEELQKIPILREASPEILGIIQKHAEEAIYAPDEAVITFGQPSTFLGIIIEGQAEMRTPASWGEPRCLEVLNAGDFFGEISLLTNEPNTFNLIAIRPTRALLIPAVVFEMWVTGDPKAMRIFSQSLARRTAIIERDRLEREELAQSGQDPDDPYGLKLISARPTKILVLNVRHSSLKYHLFDTANELNNVEGLVENIGQDGATLYHVTGKGQKTLSVKGLDHRQIIEKALELLMDPEVGVIKDKREISAVGHRVVHGGEKYSNAVIIDQQVLEDIRKASYLAPIHNIWNILGIEVAMELLPEVPHVAAFDTAFHQTMPEYAFRYAIPEELYTEHKIRRYGFHGLSHQYAGLQAAAYLKRPFSRLKMITCHLGTGSSICAIDHGRSIDTSMGLTPLEGLIMCTRSGDIDPAVVTYLMKHKGMSPDEIETMLNMESGLKALSGTSGDMRDVAAAANSGDRRAMMAAQAFAYRVRKYIGAYFAALGGLDALVFTGGIGENSAGIRALACQGLWHLGILIDEVRNRQVDVSRNGVYDISDPHSKVKVLVVHSNPARMIARETLRVLGYRDISEMMRRQKRPIPIAVSAHHVHLSPEHVEALFGEGYTLTPAFELSQPGQYACEETVTLVGPRREIPRVRVLGPPRGETQVEISRTEEFQLGINAPVRMSGDLEGTPGLIIRGPKGEVKLDKGVIIAHRHIHMSPEDALLFGLKDKDVVMVRVEGDRELIFGDVIVRVHPNFRLEMHVDTDEGNAAQLGPNAIGYLEGIQRRGANE